MRKIVNLKQEKQKKEESALLIKGTLVPLMVGLALLYNIPSGIFRIIGWLILIFGLFGGFFYLREIYLKHKERIWEKIPNIFKKKKDKN